MKDAHATAQRLIAMRGWDKERLFDTTCGERWSAYRAWLCRDLMREGYADQDIMAATGLTAHSLGQARRRLGGAV
jgi:hypothetical protein